MSQSIPKRNIVLIILLLIALIASLAALAAVYLRQPSNERFTLKFWGYWEPEIAAALLTDYQTTHPRVTIEYEKRELGRYRETLQNRLDNGSGPDIFYFHSKWLPMLVRQLSIAPKNIFDEKELLSAYFPVAKKDLAPSGQVWGAPVSFEGLSLLYNNELFRAVGLDKPPSSWDELKLKYISALVMKNKTGEIQTGGIALGTAANVDYASQILELLMAQNGTTFIKNNQLLIDQSFSAETPKRNLGADALTFYNSFAQGQGSTWAADLPSSVEAFVKGQVAMIIAPNSRINEILKLSQEQATPVDLKVALLPQLPERDPITWGTTWALGVSSYSQRQKESWEFIKYLSSKEVSEKITTLQKRLVTVPDIPARLDASSALKDDPYLGPYIAQAPKAADFYGVEHTEDNGLNDQVSEIFHEMIDTPGSAESKLNLAAAKLNQVFISYNLLPLPVKTEK